MSNDDTGTSEDKKEEETSTQEETTQTEESEATQKDEVTLSKKDYQELISKRDKNFNKAEEALAKAERMEAEQARNQYIGEWLEDPDNKKKYPDVKQEDLRNALDEDDVEAIAKHTQKRVQEIEQRALKKLEVTTGQPLLTKKEADEQLKELSDAAEEGKDPDAFEKAMNIQFNTKR